jgi:hypothetical protein
MLTDELVGALSPTQVDDLSLMTALVIDALRAGEIKTSPIVVRSMAVALQKKLRARL